MFRLTGTVTDAETGLPIAGARVASIFMNRGPERAVRAFWTDERGRFELMTWDEPQTVNVSAEGHHAGEVEFASNSSPPSTAGELAIKLLPRPPLVPAETKQPGPNVVLGSAQVREVQRLLALACDQVDHRNPDAQNTLHALFRAYHSFNDAVTSTDLELPFQFGTAVEQAMTAATRLDFDGSRRLIDERLRPAATELSLLQRAQRLEAMLGGTASPASAAGGSRAPGPTQQGITVVLRNATNTAHWVGLETSYPLLPGETLVALTKLPDGRIEINPANVFLSRWPTETRIGTSLTWYFPDYFGAHELESAAFQLRRNIQGRPIRLTPGEPLTLFSMTNQFGDALSGYLEFQRFVPDRPAPDERVHASVTLTTWIPAFYSGAYYSANVPPGYRLLATASPSRHETTSIHGTNGSSSWSLTQGFLTSRGQDAMARQLEDLAKHGPVQVFLGEPRLLFSLTNDAGAVYRGFFELVGPPAAAAALPEQFSSAGGSSEAVPSLAPPAAEGKFIMDTWGSGRAEAKPGELIWRFKSFVPPGSLASLLFVHWTNGVPQVDPGFSAYFKVGKGGGIDIPFCSLQCHRLVETEAWKEMNEDQRRQALVRMGYPESAGVTNAFYWSVNLGSGWAEGCWTNMPPYHGLQLQLPQSVHSGHQRAVRLIDFDTPEGKGSQGHSGVELRIFLEPLKSPPLRMVPNEKDHTNYISGTGLAGTMEDALRAIREWPTDP